MLTHQRITEVAQAHVQDVYGDNWVPDRGIPITNPEGVFFRIAHVEGIEYTGHPSPIFVYQETGRFVILGQVPFIENLAAMAAQDPDLAQALALPEHPRHAELIVPYVRRALAFAEAHGPSIEEVKRCWHPDEPAA